MPDRAEIIEAAKRGDLDKLLALVSLDEIADAWWRYTMRTGSLDQRAADDQWETDPDGWASEIYYTDIYKDEDTRREYLRAQEARSTDSFRRALATVWIEDLGPTVFLRLQAAARTELVWHVNHGPRPMRDGSFADPCFHRCMTSSTFVKGHSETLAQASAAGL